MRKRRLRTTTNHNRLVEFWASPNIADWIEEQWLFPNLDIPPPQPNVEKENFDD